MSLTSSFELYSYLTGIHCRSQIYSTGLIDDECRHTRFAEVHMAGLLRNQQTHSSVPSLMQRQNYAM